MTINRIGTTKRWSDIVIHQNTLYLVEVPINISNDLKNQTIELLNLIENSLKNNGSDKSHILSVTIYLKDITQIEIFNSIWDEWLPNGTAPSRACIEANLANKDYLVEIQLIAAAK